MIRTSELKPNDQVRLLGFGDTDRLYRSKLLALGMVHGALVKIIRVAPLGCPIQLELCGISIALRKSDARFLEWERV